MENKKLINILIKDMRDMEELISGIKQNRAYEPLEIDFLLSRANGMRQLLELLKSRSGEGIQEVPVAVVQEENFESIKEQEEEITKQKPVEEPVNELEEVIEVEIPEEVELPEKEIQEEVIVEKSEVQVEDSAVTIENENLSDEEVELEEIDEKNEKHTIGDSFSKERSVNDLVSDSSGNLEYKLSNMPVSSLKTAIGINDRFLFTRELFDGDSDQYAQAVNKLDNLHSIQEAVTYLRDNFKWKKNDTSLKFISLVKRRFADA